MFYKCRYSIPLIIYLIKGLPYKLGSFQLFDPAVFDDVVKEFPTGSVLHDKEEKEIIFQDLVELHNLRMTDPPQNIDFSGDAFDIPLLHNFAFVQNFDSDRLERLSVDAQFHLAEGALPDGLLQRVVTYRLGHLKFITSIQINIQNM